MLVKILLLWSIQKFKIQVIKKKKKKMDQAISE